MYKVIRSVFNYSAWGGLSLKILANIGTRNCGCLSNNEISLYYITLFIHITLEYLSSPICGFIVIRDSKN